MTSWRDTASEAAQDDLDGLLNNALPFAQQMLEKNGEFYPYGVAFDETGEHRMIAGDPDGSEHPPSLEVLAILVEGMRSQRRELRAVALVSDVRLADSDAIRVELEHREGPCMAVVLPYRTRRMRRGVEFGALAAASGNPQVWSGP